MSDSDDLNMSESEVGKLAVTIEKEMFNLCLSTDSKYKNKYRSLMFNLKDPKNKVSPQCFCNLCKYIFSSSVKLSKCCQRIYLPQADVVTLHVFWAVSFVQSAASLGKQMTLARRQT